MAEGQANEQGQTRKLSDLSDGELEQLQTQIETQPQSSAGDVEIPVEMIPGENQDAPAGGTQDGKGTQSDGVPEDTRPDYLKDTPFKTEADAVKAWKNLNSLVGKQGQQLDELQRRLQGQGQPGTQVPTQPGQPYPAQPMQTPGQPYQPVQPTQYPQQPGYPMQQQYPAGSTGQAPGAQVEYDPFDQQSVDQYINRRFNSMAAPLLNQVNAGQAMVQNLVSTLNDNQWYEAADRFTEQHPELAIEDNLSNIQNVMKAAQAQGLDPNESHPEARKVQAMMGLIDMVKNSNGYVQDLEHAYRIKQTEGDGLSQLLLDNTRQATIDAVNHINGKGNTAPSLANAGATPPKTKRLSELSDEELFQLSEQMTAANPDSEKIERISRF